MCADQAKLFRQIIDGQTNHKTGIPGEIMSNNFFLDTTGGTYLNSATLTATTSGDVTSTINLNDTNNTWFPHYMESTWMPYHYESYKPEFHIKLGYKNQLKTMWD